MIAALEVYDAAVLRALCENTEVTGAVLGDPLCTYRMFAGGEAELADCMHQLKDAGREVYYQTPCYLTDEVYLRTLRQLHYWAEHDLLDGVLLQDIGLLAALGREKFSPGLIWSMAGEGRSRASNLMHYQLLQSLARVRIADDQPRHLELFEKFGIPALPVYGRLDYDTVNRLCYYTYENDLYGEDCGRACLKGEQHLVNEVFHQDMTVDGYFLGKRYTYIESDLMPELIYAADYDAFMSCCASKRKRNKE